MRNSLENAILVMSYVNGAVRFCLHYNIQ